MSDRVVPDEDRSRPEPAQSGDGAERDHRRLSLLDEQACKPEAPQKQDERREPTPPPHEDRDRREDDRSDQKKNDKEDRDGKSEDKDDDEKKPHVGIIDRVRQHPFITLGIAVVLIAAIVAGVLWYLNSLHYESTDDAFVDARVAPISTQVAGAIVDVPVTDNQMVEKGAVLVRIDDRDYKAALAQAKAQVDQARASIDNLTAQIGAQQASIDQAEKQVTQAQAALDLSRQENTRFQGLLKAGAGTREQADQTSSDFQQKQAALAAGQANLLGAQKQVGVLRSQQKVVEAQLEQANAQEAAAQANMSRTSVLAPVDGRATRITAANGLYAQPGQSVMMFVPRTLWITANFKETQLTYMRPGQPVDIYIDAYPGRAIRGHVDSIQAGSGTVFSLLPAENATGNYVKVVQRVPVKIVFDAPPDVYIGPGMSVTPTVRVR